MGGALQIAAASAIYDIAFSVHSPFGVHTIGSGLPCHLWYSTDPVGHYDVWTADALEVQPARQPAQAAPVAAPRPPAPLPPEGPCPPSAPRVRLPVTRLGGLTPHLITSVNVGGSRAAIIHALQQPGMVLLLQEHRQLGTGIPSLQLLARHAGLHGIWDPAVTQGDQGRSGGTAVLVRLPLQIHRGTTLSRATHVIVPWTRTQRIHLVSVYGPPGTDPQGDHIRLQLYEQLQELLASIGRVPWLMGGDWNVTPAEFTSQWHRPCQVAHTGGPTHKHGRNLDWFAHSALLAPYRPKAHIMPFTDHVAVSLRLRGDLHRTLGNRLVSPAGIPDDRLRPL